MERFHRLNRLIGILFGCCFVLIFLFTVSVSLWVWPEKFQSLLVPSPTQEIRPLDTLWHAPDTLSIPKGPDGDQIRRGRELIKYTSRFFGPEGSIRQMSNGMNCQNCHLEAGTRAFGNNYGSVASQYPKYRARSGSMESIEKRINDCFLRSLNGDSLPSRSEEMKAMVAYLKWVGKDVPPKKKAHGSGLVKLRWLERAASPERGKEIFKTKCIRCHEKDGQGKHGHYSYYEYPPLWGDHSFNTAAGLYRISNLAGYVYANMPNGSTIDKPDLLEEEAWDVAAYIISMPRPVKHFAGNWPSLKDKPVDHPFGPYTDSFPELQHQYGPFATIEKTHKSKTR